jgi:FAD/FMN-containing dehydrogenase
VSSDTTARRIVLLFGSGIDAERSTALASEDSQLAVILRSATEPVDVSVISLGLSRMIAGTSEHLRLDGSGRSPTDRLLAAVGASAVKARFSAFPLGRLLNSLGPVDPGRIFWRTVRRNPDAMRLLRDADIAIAADLAATKTAWLAVHRGWVGDALYDHRSASVGISLRLPSVD